MKASAKGTFEVKLIPQTDEHAQPLMGRMTIDKTFSGGLTGTSRGQMLSAGTAMQGSAGYVAIEQVDGQLDGRQGTFILQHNATMSQGNGSLNIIVVPDSGTGSLTGLNGQLNINIIDKVHHYSFDYELPDNA